MDFLRELVGGPKNRYKDNGYNLDLTYITPRIIAMAFPASGFEKLYRNNIDTIAQFFQTRHSNKYITINISGRSIDQSLLQNVLSFDWQDHKAPPFDTLFVICDEVAHFLRQDKERVAVFHCNHGKGRTGTIICCFFLFMGVFKEYKQVMQFYGRRRFQKEGYGVTQPCQIQYIRYFQQFLGTPNCYPQVLSIKKLTFRGGFTFTNPYIKLVNMTTGKVLYSTKEMQHALHVEKEGTHTIVFTQKHWFAGDVTMQLKESRSLGKNLLISYVFNTAFVVCQKQEANVYRPTRIKLQELSPLGKQKQNNFEDDFIVEIQFRKFCDCGDSRRIQGCGRCEGVLGGEFDKWQRIKAALKNRQLLLGQADEICFGEQGDLQI